MKDLLYVGIAGNEQLFVADFFGRLDDVVVLHALTGEVVDFVRQAGGLMVHVVADNSEQPVGFCAGDMLVCLSRESGHLDKLLGDAVGDWLVRLAA